jgi:6-phosphogluconate dehydrogenase
MMIGGDKEAVEYLRPIFETLAPGADKGWGHVGPAGSGHFVKMVHNGIEYGMMQAYAEGFDILRNKDSKDLPEDERFALNMPDIAEVWRRGSVISSWLLDLGAAALAKDLPEDERFALDMPDIAEVWRRGSVISSWLLDLGAAALAKDPHLKDFSGFVQDSGEGRWTIEAAIEEAVPADVLAAALFARFRSRQEHTFGEKMLSAMRFGFGGHIEGKEPIDPDRSATQRAAE